MEVIDLFRESFTVDELGLAAVRDSFSDLFFPGTSTIQTRACYFLLVPWTFLRLERLRVPSEKVAERARWEELKLSERMLAEDEAHGIFGALAGNTLKRLPSGVYWGGLRSWGISTFPGHKGGYYRSLDRFYQHKDNFKIAPADPEGKRPPPANWHSHIPDPPSGFPYENVSVDLRRRDAEYLRDRIQARHPDSLLALLAARADAGDLEVDYLWELSHLNDIPPALQTSMHDARLFAVCMQGAVLLYNLMLSELQRHELRIETYRHELAQWAVDAQELEADWQDWQLEGVWRMVRGQGRSPAFPMQEFVGRWVSQLRQNGAAGVVGEHSAARVLVRDREMQIKRGRSRIANARHLELWGGRSGTGRLGFRWSAAQRILADVFTGLSEGSKEPG